VFRSSEGGGSGVAEGETAVEEGVVAEMIGAVGAGGIEAAEEGLKEGVKDFDVVENEKDVWLEAR